MKDQKDRGLIAAILIAAVLISSALVFLAIRTNSSDTIKIAVTEALTDFVVNGPQKAAADDSKDNNVPEIDMEELVDDDPVEGDEDAPVTIVEFSDYQCPYCIRFINETYPSIKSNYIDTGKVKLVFRDFPLNGHARALPAANAATCVYEQAGDDGYFEMHDALWDSASGDSSTALTDENLLKLGKMIVTDDQQFEDCVTSQKYVEEANKDTSDGVENGVGGTPTFFINGQMLVGARPYADFEAAIEKALEED